MSAAAINNAVRRPCGRSLGPATGTSYSAHSLPAGCAIYASQRGTSDWDIAYQSRRRSLTSLDLYIRRENTRTDNAATAVDL